MEEVRRWLMFLFSILCVLISIKCLGCSFKEIFRTLKDFLLLLVKKGPLNCFYCIISYTGLVIRE